MEHVSFAQDVLQKVAEQAASCRLGQAALRHVDRALWVVEKCAKWAVPPPLDVDDTPQPELVRPLPWVFFLAMLVALRVTRESLSLVNLIRGKPPLRSADVVMYIQSKRRYLRTLKYQGNRNIRARSGPGGGEPWYSGLRALCEFTMCFRRSHAYGNNNTTQFSNNDEVLVVKRSKRTRSAGGAGGPGGEGGSGAGAGAGGAGGAADTTMERLIEKMMVQLDADSDDDSSYTLTNATSVRSDQSEESDPEQDSVLENHTPSPRAQSLPSPAAAADTDDVTAPAPASAAASPPPTDVAATSTTNNEKSEIHDKETDKPKQENRTNKEQPASPGKVALSEPTTNISANKSPTKSEPPKERKPMKYSHPKESTNNFLQNERCPPQNQPSKQAKFGTKIADAFSKTFTFKKNKHTDTVDLGLVTHKDSEAPVQRISQSHDSLI